MAKSHVIVVHFDSDDPMAVNDFITIIKSVAPYMVDNVEVNRERD